MRTLLTNRQYIIDVVNGLPKTVVRRGFLVHAYLGYATEVVIQLTDPTRETRGIVLKARIRPGTVLPTIPAGTPVAVQIRHGQAEVLGLSASGA